MNKVDTLDSVRRMLSEAGFLEAHLEIQESLLILKLGVSDCSSLLANPHLRRQLVSQAQAAGFDRLALEFPLRESGS